ncbi:type II toxin-antitoxin system RelE family toxin [Dyadobacter beijingensis]|uniref:type II toxin-antitoxin system RelE family toxin n=1 Tax=Dyadobacter beijingensis TaxID=365489 RepID=UPI0035B69586
MSRSADKFLSGLTGKDYCLVSAAVSSLQDDPYQPGCRKLKGRQRTFRIRAGNYRIIYEIDDCKLLVEIEEIGNRRDIYD